MATSGKREVPAPFMVGLTVEVVIPAGEYSSGVTHVAKLDGYMKSSRSEMYFLKFNGYPEEVTFIEGATIESFQPRERPVTAHVSTAQPF